MKKPVDEHDGEDEAGLAREAGRLFDESVERLDAATLSRLHRQRQRALAALGDGRRFREWQPWLPAAGIAAAAAIALLVWDGGDIRDLPPDDAASDLDLLMAGESLEMLEDLEFYRWLDQEDAEAAPDDHVG